MREIIEFLKKNKKKLIELYNIYRYILDRDPTMAQIFELIKEDDKSSI